MRDSFVTIQAIPQDFLLGRRLVTIKKQTNKKRTRGFVSLFLNPNKPPEPTQEESLRDLS